MTKMEGRGNLKCNFIFKKQFKNTVFSISMKRNWGFIFCNDFRSITEISKGSLVAAIINL